MSLSPQFARVQSGRRTPGSVQANDPVGAGGRQQNKTIAAKAGHLRLAYSQQHRARDGRIDRIATAFKDLHGYLGRQRV